LYLSEILVPSTRLAAFASAPVGLKLGFSLFGGAPPYFDGGCAESSRPRKETSCEGSGFFARWCGEADRERDGDRVRRRRLGGGEADAEADRVRCLRGRWVRGERDRRASFDLSLRLLSRDRERCRLCLSLDLSRFPSLTRSLSFDRSRRRSLEPSRRRSLDLSRRLSLERLLFRSPDLSRLPSLSRRRSRERSPLWSRDLSRFLSLDGSRGFRYGSGEGSRLPEPTVGAAGGTASGLRSLGDPLGCASLSMLLRRRSGRAEVSFRAWSDPFLNGFSRLRLLLLLRCGVPFLSAASFCVRSLRALNGDSSLAMLRPSSQRGRGVGRR